MLPVWMSDHPRNQDGAAEFRVGVLYSDDHGATFHAGGTIIGPYDAMNETSIYEGSDGTVYANSRVSGLGYRAVSASGDAGMTWSTPAPDYELSDPTCQASTLVLPSADGVNRLLFCNPAGPDRTHLTVRLSYDDGATWPVSRLIDAGPSGYCDMAADPQGNIYVFYENNTTSSVGNISMAKFNLDWLLEEEPSWRDEFGFDGVGIHLPFANSTGGTFADATAKGITQATILGTVPVVYDTRRGTVASFNGNGANRVSLGDELDPLDAGYTVSLWFKADALEGTQFLASKGNQYSGYEGWSIFLARDDWLFVRGNHGADDDARLGVSREGIIDGEWHHVALVIDNATGSWEAYFDGAPSGENGDENGWMTGEGGGDHGQVFSWRRFRQSRRAASRRR